MSGNPIASKIAAPYSRALFDFSVEKNIMHQITADFQNLDSFLDEATENEDVHDDSDDCSHEVVIIETGSDLP